MADTNPIPQDYKLFTDNGISVDEDELGYINASPLLISLLRWYANDPKTQNLSLTRSQSGTASGGYLPDEGINIKKIGKDFVRILGHELTHAYDDVHEGTAIEDRENFQDIINQEMDESEATAASFIIRRQIMANGGPDIGISNRINKYDPDPNRDIIADLDNAYASRVSSTMTTDDFWSLTKQIAREKIWGMNFTTRPHGSTNRWEDALNEAFIDPDDQDSKIPDFLSSEVRTFTSAAINSDGKYEFIFTEQQGSAAGSKIHYIYGANTGGSGPDLLVVGDNDHHLQGGAGNDVLVGNWTRLGELDDAGDILDGGAGNDTFIIHGTDENPKAFDTFNGGEGTDTILGGDQDDTIRVNNLSLAANSIEVIDGGAGENIIAGTSGSDTIDLSGIDVQHINRIEGGNGADTINRHRP